MDTAFPGSFYYGIHAKDSLANAHHHCMDRGHPAAGHLDRLAHRARLALEPGPSGSPVCGRVRAHPAALAAGHGLCKAGGRLDVCRDPGDDPLVVPSREMEEQVFWPRGRLFRLCAAGIILLVVWVATPAVDTIMADAGYAITGGSLILIGMGLLHLGITSYILRVVIGLMTVLSGFEILYSAVEGSILVAALLATINLGLALVGAYLMIAQYNAREAEAQAE